MTNLMTFNKLMFRADPKIYHWLSIYYDHDHLDHKVYVSHSKFLKSTREEAPLTDYYLFTSVQTDMQHADLIAGAVCDFSGIIHLAM